MAFDKTNFACISGGDLPAGGTLYFYKSTDVDTVIETAGYFTGTRLKKDDFIKVIGSVGGTETVKELVVTDVTDGTVTTAVAWAKA